ncbi:hypothetical protein, partial [Streptomyces sp. NPDC001719]
GTIRWESQAANCTVVYKTMDGEEMRCDVGAEKEWFTPHLTTYTNFRVEARSVEGQNSLVYALNTTALVDTPDLNLHTLNVGGTTTFSNTVTIATGQALSVDTIKVSPNGRPNIAFFDDVWLDEKDLYVKGNIETRKTNAGAKGLLKVSGDTTLNGHLTVANGKSIRTKYLRGLVDGDRTLVIDEDKTGTELPGPVKLLSAVNYWNPVPKDRWSEPEDSDFLYFGNSGAVECSIDIAVPGGIPAYTVQVDGGFCFVVPAGWQYRKRGEGNLKVFFVKFGRSL